MKKEKELRMADLEVMDRFMCQAFINDTIRVDAKMSDFANNKAVVVISKKLSRKDPHYAQGEMTYRHYEEIRKIAERECGRRIPVKFLDEK